MSRLSSINRAASIGYWISEDMQGRGIATRCVDALVSAAFLHHGMNQVIVLVAEDNAASRAIPERLGFARTARLRQQSVNGRGEFLDQIVYSLLRSEWEASDGGRGD